MMVGTFGIYYKLTKVRLESMNQKFSLYVLITYVFVWIQVLNLQSAISVTM